MVLVCLMVGSGLLATSARAQAGQTTDAGTVIALTSAERKWLAENHTVRVRVSDWPPYMLTKPAPSGLSVDYLNAIAKRFGFKVEYVPDTTGWPASMQDVIGARQHYDLILTMHRSPERERQLTFTDDYLSMPWVIYARKDSSFISGLNSLRGKTVAAEKGYVIVDKLKSSYPAIRILEVVRPEDALRAVAVGQADAYVGNLANATFLIKEYGLTNLVVAAPTTFGEHTHAMAIRKDWPELASLINKGLAAMPFEEHDALRQKWLAVEVRPQTDYTLTWLITVAATLILLVIFYWNRRLVREVTHRQLVESDLREEKERAQRYLDTVQSIMVALDKDGNVTMINRAGCALLGFEEGELLGHNWFATCLPQPEDMATVYPMFQRIMAGDLEPAEYFENAIRCKDGRERLCAWHNAYFRDANGNIVGTLSSGEDITERKRAETDMFAAQSELSATLDALPDLLFELDLDGCFHDYRASRPELLAAPPEAFLGKTLHDVLPLEAADEVMSALREAHETGCSHGRQIELQVPQGKSWFELSVARKSVAAGAAPRFIMLSRDISERKLHIEELQRWHDIFEHAEWGVVIGSPDGSMLELMNPAFARMHGYTVEELTGRPIIDVFAPVGREILAEQIQLAHMKGHHSFESLHLRKDGTVFPVLIDITTVRGPSGEVLHRIVNVQDITKRKQAERLLHEQQQTLAAREQEFRSLAESSPDAIMRYDREGRIHYLNQKLSRDLGFTEAELIGKTTGEVWPDNRFAVIAQAVMRAIGSGEATTVELSHPLATGESIFSQIRVVAERDAAGRIVGALAFGRDVTAIRKAERKLRHFIDNLPGLAYTFRQTPDGHGCFPFFSSGIEKIYGLRPEDVKDDMAPIHALAHPDDRPRIEAAIAESARTMTPFRNEFRICRPGLPERWVDARSMPEREADGSIRWYGIMLDITERKRTQGRSRP